MDSFYESFKPRFSKINGRLFICLNRKTAYLLAFYGFIFFAFGTNISPEHITSLWSLCVYSISLESLTGSSFLCSISLNLLQFVCLVCFLYPLSLLEVHIPCACLLSLVHVTDSCSLFVFYISWASYTFLCFVCVIYLLSLLRIHLLSVCYISTVYLTGSCSLCVYSISSLLLVPVPFFYSISSKPLTGERCLFMFYIPCSCSPTLFYISWVSHFQGYIPCLCFITIQWNLQVYISCLCYIYIELLAGSYLLSVIYYDNISVSYRQLHIACSIFPEPTICSYNMFLFHCFVLYKLILVYLFMLLCLCSISHDLISFVFFRCLCSISQELLKFCFRYSCFISNEALTGLFPLNANVLYFISPVFSLF